MNEKKISWFKKHKILTIIGVLILLLVVIGALSGKTPTAPAKTTSKSTKTLSNAVPAMTYQVASWETQHSTVFTTLGNDMSAFGKDAQALNYSAVSADCQKIQADASAAQSYPPIPDPSIEQYWSDMLSNLNSGGQDCVSAVNNTDANQMTQADNEFNKATTDIQTISGALQLATKEVNNSK